MSAALMSVKSTHLCVLTGRALSLSQVIDNLTASVVTSRTSWALPATENSMSSTSFVGRIKGLRA
eukprot:5111430-Amphidinium_carterae.1